MIYANKGHVVDHLVGVLLLGALLWGPIVSNVEQAKYSVVASEKDIEIRNYAPVIVAETEVAGERDKAISEGFRTIADYIFGSNLSSQKVVMTAPVTQQASEKIAMTAPVTRARDRKYLASTLCHARQLHHRYFAEAQEPCGQA